VDVRVIRTEGLGDTTYLAVHDGVGILVDPQRDVDRFLTLADEAGGAVGWVLETHVHNDYVSGALEAARQAGARLVLPAGAGAAFDHTPAFHGEDLDAGGLVIRPLHTPGHTPEHCSYLILAEGQPIAVFTGGSLLVGAAGRTDLLGRERARQLAKLQHGSLRRLAALPGTVAVYPTHGQGSFCADSDAGGRVTSTVADELRSNPTLAYPDAEAFARGQLAGLQPYPAYYTHMAPINLRGPSPVPARAVPQLSLDEVDATAHIVDIRPHEAFAAGHLPGALSVELADEFGVWVAWLLPFGAPVVLVAAPDQPVEDAVVQLARLGFDHVRGVLRWAGGRGVSYREVGVDEFARAARAGAQVLDVRSPAEWDSEHIPGSVLRYLPDLVTGAPLGLRPEQPVWVACASGYRATIAASLLERHGFTPVVLTDAGIPDVLPHPP
jgi:glyoxylase-like metal-dependent hydrolase (beta-lactamase superfamily II)/rhodanese-related sulfurtransferase